MERNQVLLVQGVGPLLQLVTRQPSWDRLARTARQLGITREGLYKKRPTLTGIARILRNRGLT